MRMIVVGLGVQGHKRRHIAGESCVATVDPVNADADYRDVSDVPRDSYDAAFVCTPDAPKIEILRQLLSWKKHVLVEKPLWAHDAAEIEALQDLARANGVICYTAYNHRFEPHYVRMRDTIRSGVLGEVFRCRMFYGNGTARLVRESAWRDQGAGVLPDLGSHLLDTIRFWFGDQPWRFEVSTANCFENRAPDHVVIISESGRPRIELEMTLLMWRNHFTCDVLAEKGSAHISSLCKWGPATFTLRKRVLPSGRPPEESETLVQDDPTWAAEYQHFMTLCTSGAETDLSTDIWLQGEISNLGADTISKAGQ